MTPYELHKQQGHKSGHYSPNGIDRIEECHECPARFLHAAAFDYPISMRPAKDEARGGRRSCKFYAVCGDRYNCAGCTGYEHY